MKYTEKELISLKDNNPILDIFREKGFAIEKRGRNFATLCPFHPDKNPSLIITPDNNLWNCLGCTGGKTGGDVIEFLMKYEKLSFIGAVEYLKKRNSSFILAAKKTAKIKKTSVSKQKLLNRVADFYHSTFLKDKKGYEYLKLRGIKEHNIFTHFKVGYANGTLYKTIPEKGEIIEALKELGILTENNHELFKDCVVFPILDSLGNVVHIYGRKIVTEPVKHLYLSGGHKGVFNHTILKTFDEVILTESIIDSLSLYNAGIKNTIACYGVNGLTEDHINLLKENNTKEIIILFDSDEVGKEKRVLK
ncbi:MAG: toprim domain-containing protein [Candidatus Aureabacteria bacterium]|nr:toprim domain-containing protein [Candidatus Auribacterota bacterium]